MLEQIACGEVGLTLDYFYSLTPREFNNILVGYRAKEESQFRNGWEQTRMLMHIMVLPNLKKGSKLTPMQLLPFDWDNKVKPEPIKDEKLLKKRHDFWDKVTEQHFKKE